jgi:hypothetical protein
MPMVSANLVSWSSTYTDPVVPYYTERNLRRALEILTINGLANLIYAINFNSIEFEDNFLTDAQIGAFNQAPNPGPGTAAWNRAMECAMRVRGGSAGAETTTPGSWGTPKWGPQFNLVRWILHELSAVA